MNKQIISFPKVSILIPVYNRAEIIGETLNSAVNQTYKNIEVVIVDNKSTDNTFKILKKFAKSHPNVKVYRNEKNIGPVKNWRKCLDYATGEYVKILWSDDLIAPTFIEKTLPYLVNYRNVGFAFTGTGIFKKNIKKSVKAYFIGETGIYSTTVFIKGSLLEYVFPISPGCALFRKKDVDLNLPIDIPNKLRIDFNMYAIGNDLLIYLLTAKNYPKFAFVEETLSFFRKHQSSISISSNRNNLTILYHIAKAYFVENYITDEKLKRKFNLKSLYYSLRYRNNNFGLKSPKDFYFNEEKFYID